MSDNFNVSGGIGDISDIVKSQGVSDLSWLVVDENEYRRLETLPKQNIDIIPDLQKRLIEDDGIQKAVVYEPVTFVNRNPMDSGKDTVTNPKIIKNRLSSYIISGMKDEDIKHRLSSEFTENDIISASPELDGILSERGLLGSVYVDSNNFNCKDQKEEKFIKKHASGSLFIIANSKCSGCIKNSCGSCTLYDKQIVNSVPYTKKTLAHYLPMLKSENRLAGDINMPVKDILQKSFLSEPKKSKFINNNHSFQIAKEVTVTKSDATKFLSRVADNKARRVTLSTNFVKLSNIMMNNGVVNDADFRMSDTSCLSDEVGLLGHTYFDIDSYGDCNDLSNKVTSGAISPVFFILRGTCKCCCGEPGGGCDKLRSVAPFLSDKSEYVYGPDSFRNAAERAVKSGRIKFATMKKASDVILSKTSRNWKSITAQLNVLSINDAQQVNDYTGLLNSAKSTDTVVVKMIDREDFKKFAYQQMNLGKSDEALSAAICSRYDKSELYTVSDLYGDIEKRNGVQGYEFIDPSAYDDFGFGCQDGSRIFRNRKPNNVLLCEKCKGCVLNSNGWCSKYSKTLIPSIPNKKVVKNALPVISETDHESYGLEKPPIDMTCTDSPAPIKIVLGKNYM